MTVSMHVLATAGHVDHGKSTLVRRLTGMEPDRWAEERRRGMTIDLGFAWTTLPTLPNEPIAFVDVPGHERFVTNMLAGAGPVPAAMLVVAADEGWMPQSGEHLDALHALGVRHGLLVVTRSDLAEPELARDEAREHLAGSTLEHIGAVCVSGATGEGLDELRAALADLVAQLPAPDPHAPVRLWVDRAFTVRGAGTVVTGTLPAGRVQVGDELALQPGGRSVTVRSVQSLGEPVDEVGAVARVALNLRGVPRDAVRRGHALTTPGRWLATRQLDVRLHPPRRPDPRSGTADRLPEELTLHVGAAAVPARVRPLGADTVRLTLPTPLPLRIGDAALLRDPGARRVLTGLTVLDVRPPALRRRGAAAARATELATMDGHPDAAAELRRRGLVRAEELAAMGAGPPAGPGAGGWVVDPEHAAALAARLAAAVAEHAAADPLQPGLPVEAARRAVGLPDARLLDLLLAEKAAEGLVVRDGRVQRSAAAELPAALRRALEQVRSELAERPFAAPEANRLTELGLGPRELAAAAKAGELLKLGDGVFLLPGADDQAVEVLAGLPSPFTLSEARQALSTTRRVALPLLELLARQGRTRRLPDGRHQLR